MCVRSVGLRTSRPQVRECSSGIVKGKERDRIEGPGPVFSPSLPQGAIGVPWFGKHWCTTHNQLLALKSDSLIVKMGPWKCIFILNMCQTHRKKVWEMYAEQRLGMRSCVRFSYPSLCLLVFSNFLIGHVCVLFTKSLNLFSKLALHSFAFYFTIVIMNYFILIL